MIISGLQTTTLLDYPGLVACTVFTGGCNFRCPFCHNGDIVLKPSEEYSEEDIMKFLNKRKGILDGVCITGGEPTLNTDLVDFVKKIKALGLKVKLDTNGSNPHAVRGLIEAGLLDYIAMDIKAGSDSYGKAVGIDGYDIKNVRESVRLIMESGLQYEFRTTLVKGIHEDTDMISIGEMIGGAKAYYLQSYKENEKEIGKMKNEENGFDSFSEGEINHFLDIAQKYCNAMVR